MAQSQSETPKTVATECCPWCEGESWTLKTINGELRVRCTGCNASFLPEELEEAVSNRGRNK